MIDRARRSGKLLRKPLAVMQSEPWQISYILKVSPKIRTGSSHVDQSSSSTRESSRLGQGRFLSPQTPKKVDAPEQVTQNGRSDADVYSDDEQACANHPNNDGLPSVGCSKV
jgi:hypothetical protein